MTYDQYKLATPPDEPYICDYCGCEIPEDEVSIIPTDNRYVSYTACPDCAREEIEKQAELQAALARMEDE